MFGLGPAEFFIVPVFLFFYIALPIAVIAILYRLYRIMEKIEKKLDRES